jgi:Na+:H+ antiporter, NhaA family
MSGGTPPPDEELRVPWAKSQRTVARRVLQPLQSFLQAEASSALLLLIAAVLAIAWANSPWNDAYEDLWRTSVMVRVGGWVLREDLRHVVNDGLMALFFLVVGLEIKREFLTGELREPKAAAVPVVAALGGMVVPALIYLALNAGGEGSRGWGIPMATDIAFALGVLTLAARSAPASLKPFLLTLAIVDDIGAILVIAIFYSAGVEMGALVVAAGVTGLIIVLQRFDVRAAVVYVALGMALWFALFEAGIHPTIAGVILGLVTPAAPFQRPRAVSAEAVRTAENTVDHPEPPDADAPQWLRLATLSREAVSPLARAEAALHPWTSYVVIPLFAFANAGVRLSAEALREATTSPVTLGVVLGLVVGKVLGIMLASAIAVRTGVGQLPAGCGWRHMVGMSAVAGIGFTVSLFIAELAFEEPRLGASLLAGVIGYVVLRSERALERGGKRQLAD